MSKFISIKDPMGNYAINTDKVIAVSEDVEGKFGAIIVVEGLPKPIELRTPYEEIAALFI